MWMIDVFSPARSAFMRHRRGTVKNYAQIRLQVRQNKVCIGQDTALDIPAAEDGAAVKGGVAACEALDV